MNEQSADAVHGQLNDYRFELNDPWDGPGDYGFALTGPGFREGFGEVSVDETATLKLDGVPIESDEPANAFPEEVVVGLFEVLVAHDTELQEYMEEHGEDRLRSIFARHVDRLRESLIVAVHTAMSGTSASA
jgi:hypothetical protein